MNVEHFGSGYFDLGRFGTDISATDISPTENTKGGCFGHNHKLWVGVDSLHVFMCSAFLRLSSTIPVL